jgi:hypothetical protein
LSSASQSGHFVVFITFTSCGFNFAACFIVCYHLLLEMST